MPPIDPIRTERLILRELAAEDWRPTLALRSDPEVMRYMGLPRETEEETRAFVARCVASQPDEPRRWLPLSIVLRADERVIGGCGLTMSSNVAGEADVGYLLERASWGKGYATEALRALLGVGFENMGAHRIVANCAVENAASARVLDKVGMRREGLLRQQVWTGERWRDCHLYAILEDEWRAE